MAEHAHSTPAHQSPEATYVTPRRILLSASGAVLSAMFRTTTVAAAGSKPAVPGSLILAGMTRLAQLDTTLEGREGNELARVEDEMYRLELAIMDATPTSTAEVVAVLMLAVSMINIGNSSTDSGDLVERGEFAARRATRALATIHDVDLKPLAGHRYLGEHIAPVFCWVA